MRTLSKNIGDHEGKDIQLYGWIAGRRDHGGIIFIDLRDYSGIAQCVLKDGLGDELRPEWVVKLLGQVVRRPEKMTNPDLPTGQWEVKINKLEILARAETPPFALDSVGYEIGEDNRLKYRYLDLRRSRLQKNLRVRQKVTNFIRQYLIDREFVEVETPILSKSTPEGARDYLVPSRLQKGKFYALPQSPQQYKQLLMVAGLERYFQIARCFRDEDTRGDRQPEFTQLDLEMSFLEQEEILQLIENLYIRLIETLFPEKKINQKPFSRLTYEEAIKKYNSDRPDLRQDKNNSNELAFIWIFDFPMFEKKEDGTIGAAHHPFTRPKGEIALDVLAYQYDLVCNGFEIGGGSLRTHDREVLKKVFDFLGHSEENFMERFGHLWEAFAFGVPPHGGIAMGLDRFLAILLGEPNIREVIAFPKTGDGRDLMMGAPSVVDKNQLRDLGLK